VLRIEERIAPDRDRRRAKVLRARDPQKLALAKHPVEDMLEPVRRAQSNSACALSRRKQGFESPRERQLEQWFRKKFHLGERAVSNFSPIDSCPLSDLHLEEMKKSLAALRC
jgi:hypothetical protein